MLWLVNCRMDLAGVDNSERSTLSGGRMHEAIYNLLDKIYFVLILYIFGRYSLILVALNSEMYVGCDLQQQRARRTCENRLKRCRSRINRLAACLVLRGVCC